MRSHVSPLFSRVVGARPWQALLASDEPPACEVINAGGAGTAFLVCDHASNRVPRLLGNLGLEPAQLADHIGWDPGAAEVARRLSGHLDAPGLSGCSRLAVDCNRPARQSGVDHGTERRRERTRGIGRSRPEIGRRA